MPESVCLRRLAGYDDPGLDAAVSGLLDAAGCPARPGSRVLVKPNLVAPRNTALSCTTPAVVRAVCRHLLGRGAMVTVADSPAFGTGPIVARLSGLAEALSGLPVRLANLDRPRSLPLSRGGSIGVSRLALEAELIVNVPRLKCHDQMGMTLAVKNLFGCVCGFRKSLAHQQLGKNPAVFARMILDILAALPPSVSLLDGVVAMHKSGPVGGEPFALGLLAAAQNPVALDTAVAGLLGIGPDRIPLWREALTQGLAGADPGDIAYPMEQPAAFDAAGFLTQPVASPLAFEPGRFVKGRLRSLLVTLGRGR